MVQAGVQTTGQAVNITLGMDHFDRKNRTFVALKGNTFNGEIGPASSAECIKRYELVFIEM